MLRLITGGRIPLGPIAGAIGNGTADDHAVTRVASNPVWPGLVRRSPTANSGRLAPIGHDQCVNRNRPVLPRDHRVEVYLEDSGVVDEESGNGGHERR